MNFIKILWKYKVPLFFLLSVFFLLGYFVTDYFYNNNNAKYVYIFSTDAENVDVLISKDYFDDVFAEIDENNALAQTDPNYKKISYAKIDYYSMLQNTSLKINEDNLYEYTILKKYFPNSTKSGALNSGVNRATTYLNLVFSYADFEVLHVETKIINYQNPFIVGGISTSIGLVLILGLAIFLKINSNKIIEVEDNVTIFKSVFHKKYWDYASKCFNNVKNICVISLLFSFMIICKFIPIPSGFGSLGIGLTYLFFGTICLIYGPICGIFIGLLLDILGYFIDAPNIFFLGYTLDSILAGFVYGICFYKKKITFINCLIARFIVNIVINVGLGCLWWKIIYNLNFDAYISYMFVISLPKNVLYLLPQSILIFILFKFLAKPLASFNLIDHLIADNVTLF